MAKCIGSYSVECESPFVQGVFKVKWTCPDHGGGDGRTERECPHRAKAGAAVDAAAAEIKGNTGAAQ